MSILCKEYRFSTCKVLLYDQAEIQKTWWNNHPSYELEHTSAYNLEHTSWRLWYENQGFQVIYSPPIGWSKRNSRNALGLRWIGKRKRKKKGEWSKGELEGHHSEKIELGVSKSEVMNPRRRSLTTCTSQGLSTWYCKGSQTFLILGTGSRIGSPPTSRTLSGRPEPWGPANEESVYIRKDARDQWGVIRWPMWMMLTLSVYLVSSEVVIPFR